MTKYSIRSLGSETCKVSGLEILCRCWIWEWENDTSECCYINCCLFGDVLGPTSSSCPPALYSQYQRLIHILCIMATHLLWGLNRISTWSSRLFSGLSISTSVTGWEYRVVREAQAPSSSPTPTSGSSAVSAVTQTQVSGGRMLSHFSLQSSSPAGTFGTERFSAVFNPYLASFASSSRPVSQKISHIILSACNNQNINLQLDLENLRTDAARLTDISFENINKLSVELR